MSVVHVPLVKTFCAGAVLGVAGVLIPMACTFLSFWWALAYLPLILGVSFFMAVVETNLEEFVNSKHA